MEGIMGIYEITVKTNQGEIISMERYRGKVLLIVNTATGCGFTPQYAALESLYKKYNDKGFEILDFPSNQFANQAPGTDAEINSFCNLTYGTTFPRFAKIEVNGDNEDPLFTFLKNEKGSILGSNIKWNFTKFLVDQHGNVVARYSPSDKPDKVEKMLLQLLSL
jgi:glutathione peroxidase